MAARFFGQKFIDQSATRKGFCSGVNRWNVSAPTGSIISRCLCSDADWLAHTVHCAAGISVGNFSRLKNWDVNCSDFYERAAAQWGDAPENSRPNFMFSFLNNFFFCFVSSRTVHVLSLRTRTHSTARTRLKIKINKIEIVILKIIMHFYLSTNVTNVT